MLFASRKDIVAPQCRTMFCIAVYRVFCSLMCSCITWNQELPGGPILNMSIEGQQPLIILICGILATNEKQGVVTQSRANIYYGMC